MSDDKLGRPAVTDGGTSLERALAIFHGTAAGPPPEPHGFTPRAIRLFQLLKRTVAECTCVQPTMFVNERKLWEARSCHACWTAVDLQYDLARELRLPPWEDLAVQSPDAQNPYPPGVYDAHGRWTPDADAQRRWRALDVAVKLVS
jgi:hypothetical protein